MPESATGAGWARGARAARASAVGWRRAPGTEAAHRAADAPGRSARNASAAPAWHSATPTEAPTRTGAAAGAFEDAGLPVALHLLPHRDPGPLRLPFEQRAGRGTGAVADAWSSRPSTDRQQPARWAGRLLFAIQSPLPPPPPYVPPLPIIDIAESTSTGTLLPPIVDDLITAPVPVWIGRQLDGAPARPRWHRATPREAPRRVRWSPRIVIYGGAGGGSGDTTHWDDRVVPRIPRRRYYVAVHSISIVRLPDRYPLPVRSLTLSIDYSQWAWTLSMELIGAGADALIEPGGSDGLQVEVSINGAVWVCLVETWDQRREWGTLTLTTVKGRSLTALLGPTYIRPRDYTETAARTMAQLAEQELPAGGGWSMLWQPADWLVPAGAWSYAQLSPIQAIARLAAAAGGLVMPARDELALTVRPVHRVLPWDLGPGDVDLIIPEAAILEATRRHRWQDQANAVYVHGGEVGGVQALVSRTGTAGDEYAADLAEALITHVDAARALGGRRLAALARPTSVAEIAMPVDERADFPVADLGDLVRVELDGGQTAPVTAISITVAPQGAGQRVRQRLSFGESMNEYRMLISYLPRSPLIYAVVVALHTDGTVTCEALSGGTLRVRGSASIGQPVWIRGGRVEGIAPTLPAYVVNV